MSRSIVLLLTLSLFTTPAIAHEVRPAYLELKQTSPQTYDLLWKVPARGENQRLGLHLRLPEGAKFMAPPEGSFAGGAFIERSWISRPGGLVGSEIYVEGLSATMTDALARVERADGTTQVARLTPDSPSFVVQAAPRTLHVVQTYLVLGIEHILLGVDHLLFVLALLILTAGWRRLVKTITAFTVAHSLTLTAATLGFVSLPGRPVEAVIALSIVFVACEIVRSRQGRPGLTERWPWVVSFTFGLLHGFGFAGALREIGLPQRAIPAALAFFNVGVEIGQLLFVAAALSCVALIRRARVSLPRWAELAPAYAIGGVAMFWVIQRVADF